MTVHGAGEQVMMVAPGPERRRGRLAELRGVAHDDASAGTPPRPSAPRRRSRLLEREAVLTDTRALFSKSWEHPVGPIVIEGRSGVGKTAALRSVCHLASTTGWRVLRARADGSKAGVGGSVLEQLLAQGAGGRAPEGARRPVADELAAVVGAFADAGGVVLAVDDAQWCDGASTNWLVELEHTAPQRVRVVLAVALRPPGAPLRPVDDLLSQPSSRVVTLQPLSVDAVTSLVAGYFGEGPDPSFVRACQEDTGGYPLLLLALLRAIGQAGVEPSADNAGRVLEMTSTALARSVLKKLGSLSPAAAKLLEVVVVAGGETELELAAAVADMDRATAGMAAAELAAVDLLRDGTLLAIPFGFVRRTLYAEIPPSRRAALHVTTARLLKSRGAAVEYLAPHLEAAEPSGDAWVAEQLERAGVLALKRGVPERAARYLARALAEHPSAQGRPEMLLNLARAEAVTDTVSARRRLELAMERGAGFDACAKALLDVTAAARDPASRADLAPLLEQLSRQASEAQRPARVELLSAGVLVSRTPDDFVSSSSLLRRFTAEPGARAESRGERAALALSAGVEAGRAATSPEQVASTVHRAMLGEELVTDDPLNCEIWARSLLALARSGHCGEADRVARQCQSEARSRQLEVADAEFSTTLAVSLAWQGSLPGAEAEARHALALPAGPVWARRQEAAACLAGVLTDLGQPDAAGEILTRFESAQPMSCFESHALREQRGRVRAAQGRWSEALADLRAAGRVADACGIDSPLVTGWRGHSALVLSAVGRKSDAIGQALENLELAEATGTAWAVGAALHVLAVAGEPERRLQRLQEGAELLEGAPTSRHLAALLIDLGRELRAAGESGARVRTTLRRGADIALRIGAPPLLAQAAAELRESGARPRRLALTGAESLTRSERRVAELAVKGLTNAEIANRLYVAEKTVEGHLARAYRKLHVRSRRELRGALQSSAATVGEAL